MNQAVMRANELLEADQITSAFEVMGNEIDRLQKIIDSRPAINAGLPESYIEWTHSVYELEAARAMGIACG